VYADHPCTCNTQTRHQKPSSYRIAYSALYTRAVGETESTYGRHHRMLLRTAILYGIDYKFLPSRDMRRHAHHACNLNAASAANACMTNKKAGRPIDEF